MIRPINLLNYVKTFKVVANQNFTKTFASQMNGEFTHSPKDKLFSLNFSNGTATIEYSKENGLLNLQHTAVPDIFRGKGVGNSLAKHVLDYCKTNEIKVKVSCSFLIHYLEKHPEYQSLLAGESDK